MLTRRDQVQAYRFAQTRVQAALLSGQPDRTDQPMRRQRTAGFAGIMIAALVICAVGVWGLLHPGGKEGWRTADTLVVEEETGARYVYDKADGQLHPVLNYTSARLILGTANMKVETFSRSSLAGAPRGAARGVAGLPDALPGASGLVTQPWVMCSGANAGVPWRTLSVGSPSPGRHLDSGRAVLAEIPGGRRFLVWNDTRLEVTTSSAATALQLDSAVPQRVTGDWINALAPGPDLAPPEIPGLGQRTSYRLGGATLPIGEVERVDAAGSAGATYYVALRDGLASIPLPVARLLLADLRLKVAYGGQPPSSVPRASADVGAAPKSSVQLVPAGFPTVMPAIDQPQVGGTDDGTPVLCAVYTDTTAGRSVGATVYVGGSGRDPGAAPHVIVPPGRAALVRPLAVAGQPTGALFLLTDVGVKFPVPSDDLVKVLGLGDAAPALVPAAIVDAVPTGPTLDPVRANTSVAVPLATQGTVPTGAATPDAPTPSVTPGPSPTPTPTKPRHTRRRTATATATSSPRPTTTKPPRTATRTTAASSTKK